MQPCPHCRRASTTGKKQLLQLTLPFRCWWLRASCQLATDARIHLPPPPELLGRAAEVDQVLQMLQRERQLFIVGGGGEGKSAVASAAAHHLFQAGHLPGGAFVVDLAEQAAPGEQPAWHKLNKPCQLAETSQCT